MNNARYELKMLLTQISELNAQLKSLIIASDYLAGCVSVLPAVMPEETDAPIEFIKVSNVTDKQQAIRLTCLAFDKFYAEHDVSTKSTYRLPGAINISSCYDDDIIRVVDEINHKKNIFKSIVTKSISDANLRFELIHNAFPLLITLQVYRNIKVINEPVMSVRPFWGNKQSIVRVTKEAILERLERSKKYPPNDIFKDEWIEMVERERVDVSNVPDNASLRIRRPVKVQPLMWVRNIDRKMTSIVNPLPLIVLSDRPVTVGQLKDFDANNIRHKNPPKKNKRQLLVDRIHLYRELD